MTALFDIYVDFLICSTSYTTATNLSRMTDGAISHDSVTRMLSKRDFTGADFWKQAKPFYKKIESDEGILIIDDSIEEKPYTDENDVICWHFDHCKGRNVKGINFISALYEAEGKNIPIGYDIVRKTDKYIDQETGKEKRKSPVSKQEMFRNLLKQAKKNNIKCKYVVADVWFSSKENMRFIKNDLKEDFILPVKPNRLAALSEEDYIAGNFVRVDSLNLEEGIIVWLKGVDFPIRLIRQVFTNKDESTGTIYLASSDITLTDEQVKTIYKRRWKVETYHQSLKNNASLAKSPTQTVRTQLNHFFASLCAYLRLENISITLNKNHFAIKNKIYIQALKHAMTELYRILNFQKSNCEVGKSAPAGA